VGKRITIVQGHPDPAGGHFCHALADAYAGGARSAGHELNRIEVAKIDFPLLRRNEDFYQSAPAAPVREAQEAIGWAAHLVIVYPLWLGAMPALLKAFFEQVSIAGWTSVSELDRLKEQLSYLKFWQGIMVVTDISLVGWLVSTADTARPLVVVLAIVGVGLLTLGIVMLHRQIERRIDQIGKL
jgi:putative NADPH-quinone reductase